MEILFAIMLVLGITVMLTAACYQVLSMLDGKHDFAMKVCLMALLFIFAGGAAPLALAIMGYVLAAALIIAGAIHLFERVTLTPVLSPNVKTIKKNKGDAQKPEKKPGKTPAATKKAKESSKEGAGIASKVAKDISTKKKSLKAQLAAMAVKDGSAKKEDLQAKDDDPLGDADPAKDKYPAKKSRKR